MIFSIQIEATSIWTYLNPQTQIFCSNLDNYICRLFYENAFQNTFLNDKCHAGAPGLFWGSQVLQTFW